MLSGISFHSGIDYILRYLNGTTFVICRHFIIHCDFTVVDGTAVNLNAISFHVKPA